MEAKEVSVDIKLAKLHQMLSECTLYYKETLPLCAAENAISSFCKVPLEGDFQERYIMGSQHNYDRENNFIGSQMLLPFYAAIQKECQILFEACYADARPLSGMNCLTTLLMSITDLGQKVAILPAAYGGHPSVQPVCERLGLQVYHLPYNIARWDIDYDKANELIQNNNIKYILLAPSDIIHPLAVENLDLDNRILLYDVSQMLGLMAGGVISCPIKLQNTVLFGGTHKTLPGPASGLILTNDEELHLRMEENINPKFLRHTQMHQVISLLFALLEAEYFGNKYSKEIVSVSNELGYYLEQKGFHIGKVDGKYSETHQLFLLCSPDEMTFINRNAICHGITLNKKEKALFSNTGIRLGTQEITRYGWKGKTLQIISEIISELRLENPDAEKIEYLKKKLPSKKLYYTFPQSVQQELLKALHQE